MKTLSRESVVMGFCCLIGIKAMVSHSVSNGIFDIPTRTMDDADLLEEHGRFMLANMNPNVDPCENFYEYTCGNWQNDSMVPVLGRNDTFHNAMNVKVDELILEFLKNKTVLDENSAETKTREFFDSCMNMSQDLSQGYRRIFNSIKEPILKEGETLDWMVLNFYLGFTKTPLLPLSIRYNLSSYMYEIFLEAPNELQTLNYYNFTKVAEDLKFENKAAMGEEWEELKTFEKKLFATVTETDKWKYESLEEFLEVHNSSDVNLERFFDLAFNGTTKSSWKINYNVMNFTTINKFLSKSDTGIMLKYVRWRIILVFYEMAMLLDVQSLEANCQYVTMYYFEKSLIPWFIETTFDQERRADALLLSKRLKDTFYTLIDETTWLDDETKSEAKSKLRAMGLIFGYTDNMRHRSEVDEQFKDINMTKNFWVDLMNLDKNLARANVREMGNAANNLGIDTHTANAMYSEVLNQAFVTISITQLPLYHINLPNSLKFGGIGNVISHELAHGFDSGCYKYDYNGKVRNWWSPQSLRNFKERYQCLESQYNKFIYKGVRVNGNKTSGDNIADNVGLQIAYQSYLRFLDENDTLETGKDKPLPGVDFTNKQLFFLKFAQSWCDGQSADRHLDLMSNDEHTISEFQVIGTLINMPEFSEAFNCALGTNMNPLKKCIIYGKE